MWSMLLSVKFCISEPRYCLADHDDDANQAIAVRRIVHDDYVADIAILPSALESELLCVCSGSTDKTVKLTDFILPTRS